MAVVARPGHDSGRMIAQSVRIRPAPSINAASSSSARQLPEESDQQPDRQRHRERQIRQHQARDRCSAAGARAAADTAARRSRFAETSRPPARRPAAASCRGSAAAPARRRTIDPSATDSTVVAPATTSELRIGVQKSRVGEQRAVVIEHEVARHERRRREQPALRRERREHRPVHRQQHRARPAAVANAAQRAARRS